MLSNIGMLKQPNDTDVSFRNQNGKRMQDLIELKDLNCFVQIARWGSISRASIETKLSKSTLSTGLRRLEDTLGVELFVRSSKGLNLTDAGNTYLAHSRKVFDICELAASAAQRAHTTYAGKVRLAGSTEFGTVILGAATIQLAKEYPDLEFETRVFSQNTLLVDQHNFDCYVCVGNLPDSDYRCRKMGTVRYGLYASPQFLRQHKTPRDIEEIRNLPGVVYSRHGIPEPWRLSRGPTKVTIIPRSRFDADDYWMTKYYAVSGVAVSYLPDFLVHYEVAQRALVPLLPNFRSEEIPVWAVYPQVRHRNPRVKLAIDALCGNFNNFIVDPGYTLTPQTLKNLELE